MTSRSLLRKMHTNYNWQTSKTWWFGKAKKSFQWRMLKERNWEGVVLYCVSMMCLSSRDVMIYVILMWNVFGPKLHHPICVLCLYVLFITPNGKDPHMSIQSLGMTSSPVIMMPLIYGRTGLTMLSIIIGRLTGVAFIYLRKAFDTCICIF